MNANADAARRIAVLELRVHLLIAALTRRRAITAEDLVELRLARAQCASASASAKVVAK